MPFGVWAAGTLPLGFLARYSGCLSSKKERINNYYSRAEKLTLPGKELEVASLSDEFGNDEDFPAVWAAGVNEKLLDFNHFWIFQEISISDFY